MRLRPSLRARGSGLEHANRRDDADQVYGFHTFITTRLDKRSPPHPHVHVVMKCGLSSLRLTSINRSAATSLLTFLCGRSNCTSSGRPSGTSSLARPFKLTSVTTKIKGAGSSELLQPTTPTAAPKLLPPPAHHDAAEQQRHHVCARMRVAAAVGFKVTGV